MEENPLPQAALDALDEIDRSLHQMLILAQLSAWKNWRIAWGLRRSVSNRNGGSHMMLDNKTEQK